MDSHFLAKVPKKWDPFTNITVFNAGYTSQACTTCIRLYQNLSTCGTDMSWLLSCPIRRAIFLLERQ